MSVANNKRSTDGLTLSKILLGITAFCITSLIGLLTWIGGNIMTDVADIKTQQAVSYNHQLNTDARVERLNDETKDHIKDFETFKITAYTYWQKERERNLRNN